MHVLFLQHRLNVGCFWIAFRRKVDLRDPGKEVIFPLRRIQWKLLISTTTCCSPWPSGMPAMRGCQRRRRDRHQHRAYLGWAVLRHLRIQKLVICGRALDLGLMPRGVPEAARAPSVRAGRSCSQRLRLRLEARAPASFRLDTLESLMQSGLAWGPRKEPGRRSLIKNLGEKLPEFEHITGSWLQREEYPALGYTSAQKITGKLLAELMSHLVKLLIHYEIRLPCGPRVLGIRQQHGTFGSRLGP